jgi:hypothetical protein
MDKTCEIVYKNNDQVFGISFDKVNYDDNCFALDYVNDEVEFLRDGAYVLGVQDVKPVKNKRQIFVYAGKNSFSLTPGYDNYILSYKNNCERHVFRKGDKIHIINCTKSDDKEIQVLIYLEEPKKKYKM